MAAGDPADDSTIESLRALVSVDAARLYLQLLRGREQPSSELDAAAHELLETGLASISHTTTTLFAHPPRLALTRAAANVSRRWLDAAPDIAGVVNAMHHLESQPDLGTFAADEVDDPDERQRVLEALLVGVRRQICVLQPYYDWIPDDEIANGGWTSSPDANTLPHVTQRFVYDDRLFRLGGFEDLIKRELEHGAQIRIAAHDIPTFLLIVDDTAAAYTPRPGGPGRVSTDSGLVQLLAWAFEAAWNRGVPIDRNDDLSPTQRTVNTMIGLGHSNKQIATTLGLNERTIRRRIDELLDHYNEPDRLALVRRAARSDTTT
jgi:hypothetical protein